MKKSLLGLLFIIVSLLIVGCEEKEDKVKIDIDYESKGKLMVTCKEEITYPTNDKEVTMIVITIDKNKGKVKSGEVYDTFTFASNDTYESAKAKETTAQLTYCGEGNIYGIEPENCYIEITREKMELSANIDVKRFLELATLNRENENITEKEINEIENFLKTKYSKTLECKRSEY